MYAHQYGLTRQGNIQYMYLFVFCIYFGAQRAVKTLIIQPWPVHHQNCGSTIVLFMNPILFIMNKYTHLASVVYYLPGSLQRLLLIVSFKGVHLGETRTSQHSVFTVQLLKVEHTFVSHSSINLLCQPTTIGIFSSLQLRGWTDTFDCVCLLGMPHCTLGAGCCEMLTWVWFPQKDNGFCAIRHNSRFPFSVV